MTETTGTPAVETIKTAIEDILKTIDQEREREIITRRFGLYERRETLEQIGELLGITRERVRQLEKAILARLKTAAADGKIPAISDAERLIIRDLSENGRVGRVQDVANRLSKDKASNNTRAHVAFIGELSPRFVIINETDNYHQGISIAENGNEKKIRGDIDSIVKTIKNHGQPIDIESLHGMLTFESPSQIRGLASLSKKLANLKDVWGLAKWPTVNPKNIRDKIYVILAGNGKPMHFSDISKAIKESDFKRRNVTTQAIHNELIKDKRFRHYRRHFAQGRRAASPRRNCQARTQEPPSQRNNYSAQSAKQIDVQARRQSDLHHHRTTAIIYLRIPLNLAKITEV